MTPTGPRAIAFPLKETGWKIKSKTIKAPALMGHTGNTFYNQPLKHVTMAKKPLEVYNPNASRSRLSVPDTPVRYRNSSQIVLGDRAAEKNHFRTSYGNSWMAHNLTDQATNCDILNTTSYSRKKQQYY